MPIREKTLLIISLTFAALIVLIYASSQAFLLQGYADLEAALVNRNLQRTRLALQQEIATIETFAEDWAQWDDTYEFVQTGSQDYVDSNLQESTYRTIPIHLIAIYDLQGELVWGMSYDEEVGLYPIPDHILRHFSPDSLFLNEARAMRRVSGIFAPEDGPPLLMAALPVLTSQVTGPVRGMLVFGRQLDAERASLLSELTQVDTALYRVDDPAMPADVRALRFEQPSDTFVRPQNDEIVAGYAQFTDVYGDPALVIRITISRAVYSQGVTSIQYFTFAIALLGVIVGVTVLLLIERTVLAPLARLSARIGAIGVSRDTKDRVNLPGNDEFAQLAAAVNHMLERLDRSQDSVRESEQRLQIVVANAPILLFVLDEAGVFQFAEGLGLPNARSLIGRSAVEVFGLRLEARSEKADEVVVTMSVINGHLYEMRYVTLASERSPLRTIGVATDVTEREAARAAEREQRGLAEALRDTAEALTSTLMLDEVVERISTSVERVVPHDAAMIMLIENGTATLVRSREDTTHRLSHGSNRQTVEGVPWLNRLVETGEPLVIGDMRSRRDMKWMSNVHWAQSFAAIPIFLDNVVIGVLCLYHEYANAFTQVHVQRLEMFVGQAALAIRNAKFFEAERKERQLAQTLQKTAEILSASNELSSALTQAGRLFRLVVPYDQFTLVLKRETFQHLTVGSPGGQRQGPLFSCENLVELCDALKDTDIVALDDLREHPLWHALPGYRPALRSWIGIPLYIRGALVGVITFGRYRLTPFVADDIQVIMAFVQQVALTVENLTIMGELEIRVRELREAQHQLVRMTRLSTAGEIAAGVAHQINNPLTTIVAEAYLALKNLPPEHANYESMTAIQDAARRAGHVVGRLLDLTRSLPYVMRPMDINESLENAIALVQAQIVPHLARLEVDLMPNMPPIDGSMEHLEDVWINLLLNARDALDPSRENVIKVTSRADPRKHRITVIIEDTGAGIDRENLPHIFETFYTTKAHGTGLGLTICKEIVEHHNGTIELMSRKQRGTKVVISFEIGL